MKAHTQSIHEHYEEHHQVTELFVVDWDAEHFKNTKPSKVKGCKVYTESELKDFTGEDTPESTHIHRINQLSITSFGLKKKAWSKLKEKTQDRLKQCDSIIYPTQEQSRDAVLLIEIKYTDRVFNKESHYYNFINEASEQIDDTDYQLRKLGCPLDDRIVYGMVALPLKKIEMLPTLFGATLIDTSNIRDKERILLCTDNDLLDTSFIQRHYRYFSS